MKKKVNKENQTRCKCCRGCLIYAGKRVSEKERLQRKLNPESTASVRVACCSKSASKDCGTIKPLIKIKRL